MFQNFLCFLKSLPKKAWGAIVIVVLGIISTSIAPVVTGIDYKSLFNIITSAIYNFLITPIPLWVLLLTVTLVIIISLIIIRSIIKKSQNKTEYKEEEPEKTEEEIPYLSFTKMDFKNWKLEWDYTSRGRISVIYPICKKCECALAEKHRSAGHTLYCPACNDGISYPAFYENAAAVKVIEHKIKNSLY